MPAAYRSAALAVLLLLLAAPSPAPNPTDTEPNAAWKLFTGPLRTDQTTTPRAKAIRYGYRQSPETVAPFTIAVP